MERQKQRRGVWAEIFNHIIISFQFSAAQSKSHLSGAGAPVTVADSEQPDSCHEVRGSWRLRQQQQHASPPVFRRHSVDGRWTVRGDTAVRGAPGHTWM